MYSEYRSLGACENNMPRFSGQPDLRATVSLDHYRGDSLSCRVRDAQEATGPNCYISSNLGQRKRANFLGTFPKSLEESRMTRVPELVRGAKALTLLNGSKHEVNPILFEAEMRTAHSPGRANGVALISAIRIILCQSVKSRGAGISLKLTAVHSARTSSVRP